jgi:hypothetical protein
VLRHAPATSCGVGVDDEGDQERFRLGAAHFAPDLQIDAVISQPPRQQG